MKTEDPNQGCEGRWSPRFSVKNVPGFYFVLKSAILFGGIVFAPSAQAAEVAVSPNFPAAALSGLDYSTTFNPIDPLDPITNSVILTRDSGDSSVFTLTVNINAAFDGSIDAAPGSLFLIRSDSGAVTVNSGAYLSFNSALGQRDNINSIGNAAILVLGDPTAATVGADVTVNHSGQLSVLGVGTVTNETVLQLSPSGLRTAEISGISAVSYGDQSSGHSHTWAGGNVQVTTTDGSGITMNQYDPTTITAAISASSAAGPGSGFGNNPELNQVTVKHSGMIEVNADAGVGIFATATGAQTDGSSAVGGNVGVHLYESTAGTSIEVNGLTGIGIFAVSEAYALGDSSKGSAVAGGTVEIDLDQNTSIVVGKTDALFSIGVLAVSAGTDAFINPFSSQTVSKTGSGDGGEVTVNNSGSITTTGKISVGIAAFSLGGAAQVTSVSGSNGSSSYVGSAGSTDGGGATVTVNNYADGTIQTLGEGAHGIIAISSASGGLINNDLAAAGTMAPSDLDERLTGNWENSNTGLILGNNSSSDNGHDGGEVNVLNEGTIQTGDVGVSSLASIGIIAQSIGGGGGSAGGDHAALFVGDKGGKGGDGGTVSVQTTNFSDVQTFDVNSIGILAQSIGGGGGNGANAKGVFVAVGGRGGEGGDGGMVVLNHDGAVETIALGSSGIIAQSVGGGGGHGGTATAISPIFSEGIGGKGGTGGNGGEIYATIDSGGSILTFGNASPGLHLQSVGGGGGTGGASISDSEGPLTVTMAVGGHGGQGGEGGVINAFNYGSIDTGIARTLPDIGAPILNGNDSIGIIAQSIGGGGGHGGSAIGKSLVFDPDELPISIGVDLSFGGSGGSAGSGGAVNLNNIGTVTTWGDGSLGILAQSIGGGGGSGGDSTATSTILNAGVPEVSVAVAHGGNGGGTGHGDAIILQNSGGVSTIITHGQSAAGIVAQSIGGGGGNGGAGNAHAHTPVLGGDTTNLVTNIGLGGKGGGGGNANFISLTNDGTIQTSGSGSQGILAQAIGGGGGNAAGGSASGGNNSYEFDLSIGGTGGSGGSAAVASNVNGGFSIQVANNGSITTEAGDASAILAQSIGGGGGNGGTSDVHANTGFIANIADYFVPSSTYAATISIGGKGGGGGEGGAVKVDNADGSIIETLGTRSHGIFAQSISGGGGTGGSADSTSNTAITSPFTVQNPPPPDPDHPNDPVAPPERNKNFSVNASVGGGGGDTHAGGAVTLDNEGSITTEGYSSHAIFAQSIGGGGGVAADGSLDTRTTLSLGVRIDGADGESGSGGDITIGNTGSIATTHNDAYGIFAQSIGGGGGLATQGTDIPFIISPSFGIYPNLHAGLTLGVDLKNSSDKPVDGGTVNINSGGTGPGGGSIDTQGDWSMGIVAQSIGAGGGKAGTVFGTNSLAIPVLEVQLGANKGYGNGNTVTVTLSNSTDIKTGDTGFADNDRGFGAYGIVAQSIGGGGGLATDGSSATTSGTIDFGTSTEFRTSSLNLGGQSSAASGIGNTVTLDGTGATGAVRTEGDAAHAIILQSVGGGGGIVGTGSGRDYQGSLDGMPAPAITLGGSAYGHGGTVNLTDADLDVSTYGDNAFGIILQSVGGGGGIATTKQTGGTITLGRDGDSNTQDGGEINATLVTGSSITTTGNGSHGLVAQSIGGGGGIANPDGGMGTTINTTYRAAEARGNGKNISLTVDAVISTSGTGANGILAQVIGGGGGLYNNFAGSTGGSNSTTDGDDNGTLSITQSGTLSASGAGAVGIFAQNVTGNGNRGNNIDITVNGSVTGAGIGIWVVGGKSNSVTVNTGGSVTAALNKDAVSYFGNQGLNVTNAGTVTGSIDLGYGNGPTGTFTNENGGVFNTGSGLIGHVNDSGITSVGGDGNAEATEMYSVFTQNSDAVLKLEIWSIEGYDHLDFVDGGYGDFKGKLQITMYNSGFNLQVGEIITLIGGAEANVFDFSELEFIGLGEGVTLNPFIGSDKSYNLEVAAVPEPATWVLLVMGLMVVSAAVRQKLKS